MPYWLSRNYLRVCMYVCLYVCLSAKVSLIFSSKGVFDLLITMVPSESLQNVPFGRNKHFHPKIPILPNTLEIKSWVPHTIDNPMELSFGRIDAFLGSSVEISKISILPNTIKIKLWMPHIMGYPMALIFGRMDAVIRSSVKKSKITDSTKRHENRCVGAPGHGHSDSTHVWSLRRDAVEFSRNLYAMVLISDTIKQGNHTSNYANYALQCNI